MSESIAARVDPDTADALEAEAERRDESVSSVVGDVLNDWAGDDGFDVDDEPPAPIHRADTDDGLATAPDDHDLRADLEDLRQHVETLRRVQNQIQQDAHGVNLAYWVRSGVYGQKKSLSEIDDTASVFG